MGNCVTMNHQLVHPSNLNDTTNVLKGSNPLRVKVRMTAREFKELTEQADLSKGKKDIGRLVVEKCLNGKCNVRIVDHDDYVVKESLQTISEEEEEN